MFISFPEALIKKFLPNSGTVNTPMVISTVSYPTPQLDGE